MKKSYNMSDAEREVMEKLWDQTESIRQSHLLALFEENGKEWKRQTLNTFLSRRENRMDRAVYGREEYNLLQMKESIDHMYGGKLSNFVAAFTKENGINEEEAKTLIHILEKY